MKPPTPIEPMTITQHKPSLRLVYLSLIVAILSSLPWAWMLHTERAQADALLADATARHARVSDLVITYSNGSRAYVEIGERK